MITTEQIKAARMLLGWDQVILSEMSGVPLSTLKRVESKPGPVQANTKTVWSLQAALEEAGIDFLSADIQGGVGVRLKHPELFPQKR